MGRGRAARRKGLGRLGGRKLRHSRAEGLVFQAELLTLPPEHWAAMGTFQSRAEVAPRCFRRLLQRCAVGFPGRVLTSELGPRGGAAVGDRLHFSDSA